MTGVRLQFRFQERGNSSAEDGVGTVDHRERWQSLHIRFQDGNLQAICQGRGATLSSGP